MNDVYGTIEECTGPVLMAVDFEWRPDRVGTQNRIAVVQLGLDERVWVIQLHQPGRFPSALVDLFRREDVIKVGCHMRSSDMLKLALSLDTARDLVALYDLADIAMFATMKETRKLEVLVKEYFELTPADEAQLPKSRRVTMSNWAAPRLSDEQVRYATFDAYAVAQLLKVIVPRFPAWMDVVRPLGLHRDTPILTQSVRGQPVVLYRRDVVGPDRAWVRIRTPNNGPKPDLDLALIRSLSDAFSPLRFSHVWKSKGDIELDLDISQPVPLDTHLSTSPDHLQFLEDLEDLPEFHNISSNVISIDA